VQRVVANIGPTLVRIFSPVLSAWRSEVARWKMELFEQIRHDSGDAKLSIRELAKQSGITPSAHGPAGVGQRGSAAA
jgi:hypothetical protein